MIRRIYEVSFSVEDWQIISVVNNRGNINNNKRTINTNEKLDINRKVNNNINKKRRLEVHAQFALDRFDFSEVREGKLEGGVHFQSFHFTTMNLSYETIIYNWTIITQRYINL